MNKSVCGSLAVIVLVGVQGFAQLVAGTPEDTLYRMIAAADTPAQKLDLAMQFEDEFPDSPAPVLSYVFSVLMKGYEDQQEYARARAYGEKVVAADPQNVEAYMALCRILSVSLREDLPTAVQYGERAVELAQGLVAQEAPLNYTPEQWQSYTSQTEQYARSILSYARSIQ
jgi:hypothetical protein